MQKNKPYAIFTWQHPVM